MTGFQAHHERLHLLLEKIGISGDDLAALEPHRNLFAAKKDAFAAYFYDFFLGIADTKAILKEEREPGLMKRVWASWFESFFRSEFNDDYLAYLWKVGARHVAVSLDQRFSNLGFSIIRQFCHKVTLADIPLEQRHEVLCAIDKMIDLCLLAETSAYIENTISCDISVMREVADRVRNPAMVIGWNIKKLQGKAGKGTKEYDVYQMMMGENERLEHMVRDIKIYMEVFEGEPDMVEFELEGMVRNSLDGLDIGSRYPETKVDIELGEPALCIKGDPTWFKHLFSYLIENSLEAAGKENPAVRVSSRSESGPFHNVDIEIFNSGNPPREEAEQLFSPFFSTKPTGTGFGLPIARLIVKKHHGSLSIQGVEGQGTSVIISLPGRICTFPLTRRLMRRVVYAAQGTPAEQPYPSPCPLPQGAKEYGPLWGSG